MSDYTRLMGAVKQAAVQAVEAAQPAGIYYGTVVSASPLEVHVEQKMTLKAAQLALTRNVTDYTITMAVDHATEQADGHSHGYTDPKTFQVQNALQVGERVLLMREQGGQRFIVLDRIGI